ncbi:MAG: SpoIIE family protein phosphatase, partial [Anaerolineae bacterium]|nr:SpoIIE family protein phosphatase [Anaerolineae bacterium]
GQLSPKDARTHPRRHQLYRCLGQDDAVEADTFEIVVQPGDVVLLCSDGLYDEIDDGAIRDILNQAEDIQMASRLLVAAANNAGGRDNVSVVLTRPVPAA